MTKQFIAFCFLLYAAPSLADPIKVNFTQDFGANGIVSGSFTGEDVNLDGNIVFSDAVPGVDTVSAYTLLFTPGAANSGDISSFTLGLDLLDTLEFTIGGTVVVVTGGKGPPLEHFYNCIDKFNCFVGDVDNIYSSGGANTVTSVTVPYEFTALSSSTRSTFSFPTINNSGVVAYIETRQSFSERYVVIDDGTTQTEIDLDATAGFGGFPGTPFINDQDAVAIVYSRRFASDGVLLRFNADSTVTTLATYNFDGLTGDFKDIHHSWISMNNSGHVAANVTLNSGKVAIAIIDGGGFAVVDTVTPTRFTFTGAAINDAGVVAYKAQEPAPDFVSVFTGDGFSPAQKSLPLPNDCGSVGVGPAINNNGLVAGQGPVCLAVGSDGLVSEVIVDVASNPFTSSIDRLGLNNLDQTVFEASTFPAAHSTGLFFGDDPVKDKLIQHGDPLFGETAFVVAFSGDGGFNDQGQVVFLVATVSESGAATGHVVRADLPGAPDADGDGVPDTDDLCAETIPDAEVDEFGCSAAQLDADEDGVPDAEDLCPGTNTGASVDINGCSNLQADADGDGVCNPDAASSGPAGCMGIDFCANTIIPESVPTKRLLKNHYALTGVPNNSIFQSSNTTQFTTEDTGGCSCGQIIDALELGNGHVSFGCSKGAMEEWRDMVN